MTFPKVFDLPAWPPDWPEIREAASRAIRDGSWGRYRSDQRDHLCDRLRQRFGVSTVRLTCSGTAAVEIALRAAGVVAGDAVIVAAFDYPGNLRTVELLGATPVLADIDPRTASMCVDSLQELASAAGCKAVKAVIASHLFGQAARIESMREICEQRGWMLIEDACQVPGMTISGVAAGSLGHVGTLSFGGSKPLTAGNGGAVLTDDAKLAARIAALLDRPSEAFPLSSLQAAVLLPQLERLEEWVHHRAAAAQTFASRLSAGCDPVQDVRDDVGRSYYKLAWCVENEDVRERSLSRGQKAGLPIGAGFRSSARMNPRRCRKPVPLPHSAAFGERCLVLDHRALMADRQHWEAIGRMLADLI